MTMFTSAPRRTAPATRAVSLGLLVLLTLTGCTWADTAPVPLVPEVPAPDSVAPESPAPEFPVPTSPAPDESAPGAPAPQGSTIVYSVEGTGTASVTYVTLQGGSVVQQSTSGTRLPFSKTLTVNGSGGAASTVLTLVAVGNQDTGNLSCSITRDGEVVAEQTTTGPFATVTCTSTNR